MPKWINNCLNHNFLGWWKHKERDVKRVWLCHFQFIQFAKSLLDVMTTSLNKLSLKRTDKQKARGENIKVRVQHRVVFVWEQYFSLGLELVEGKHHRAWKSSSFYPYCTERTSGKQVLRPAAVDPSRVCEITPSTGHKDTLHLYAKGLYRTCPDKDRHWSKVIILLYMNNFTFCKCITEVVI